MGQDSKIERTRVCLVQCARRCGHVLTENEYVCTPAPEWKGSTRALCPKCGGESFYTLNARGQVRKTRDTGQREINPADIEPSPKLGLKIKRRILAPKRRALSGGGGAEQEADNAHGSASIGWNGGAHPLPGGEAP